MNTSDPCVYAGLSRRSLLKLGLAAAGGILLTGVPRARATGPAQLSREIPASGERIPALGLGTARTFDAAPRAALKEVMGRFVELGGRVVDTSPMYGSAESLIGELSTELGIHDRLFLATKVWTRGREAGIRQMQRSMQRLRTHRLDLMQVHNLVDTQTQLKTMRRWKAEGRLRYIGVTHYRVDAFDELADLVRRENLDFVQFNYSALVPDAEKMLLPLAADTGTAVLINEPFDSGALFRLTRGVPLPAWAADFDCHSWAQFGLKFILSNPAVTCAIPATSDPDHLADNMQAGLGALPDVATRRKMVAYLRSL